MLPVVSSSLVIKNQTVFRIRHKIYIYPHFSAERVLLELSEEEVNVVCGAELCDEGLDVLQENLWKEMDAEA